MFTAIDQPSVRLQKEVYHVNQLTSSQGILEDLLEAQELEHGQVDCRVQTETTLVWAEGRVELNSVAAVDLDLVLVVLPDNAELDDALRDGDDLESSLVFGMLFEEGAVFEGGDQLCRVPCQPCPRWGQIDKDKGEVIPL
jgi:hypothetical protein